MHHMDLCWCSCTQPYMKLLLTALYALPLQRRTVFRGIKLSMRKICMYDRSICVREGASRMYR